MRLILWLANLIIALHPSSLVYAQNPAPLSYWAFNEGAGTTAADSAGTNPATLLNGTGWIQNAVKGAAIRLDGQNDYAGAGSFNVSGSAITIMAWVNADTHTHLPTQDARIISKARGIQEQEHIFMLSTIANSGAASLRFRLKTGTDINNNTTTLIANRTIPAGQWVHAAAVYDGSMMRLYQNGELIGSTSKTGTITQSNDQVWIGGNPPLATDRPFAGSIDEMYIFNQALTTQQIYDIAGLASPPPSPIPTPTPTGSGAAEPFSTVTVNSGDRGRTAIGDINNDGFNDIVVHEWGDNRGQTANGSLTWYQYPNWTQHKIQNENRNYFGDEVLVVDLDGDGDNDIIVPRGNDNSAQVWWYENTGNGSSWVERQIGSTQTGTEVKDIRVADMDNDGKLDVISRTRSTFTIYYQNSPTSWQETIHPNAYKSGMTSEREGMTVGDIDGDGKIDVILNGYWRANPGIRTTDSTKWPGYDIDPIWYNQNNGSWQDNAVMAAVGDINKNGRLEVVFSHSERKGYPVTIYSSSNPKGGASAWTKQQLGVVDYAETLQVYDFDGNGWLDVMSATLASDTTHGIYIFYNQNMTFSRHTVASLPAYKAAVGDIDNDGDWDITSSHTWEQSPIRLFRNNLNPPESHPLTSWKRTQVATLANNALFIYAADLNGDGKKDLVSGDGWWQQESSIHAWKVKQTLPPPFNNVLLVTDIDNDGDLDLFGSQGVGSPPNNNKLVWAENNGTGSFTVRTNINTSGNGDFPQGVTRIGQHIYISWHNGGGGVQEVTIPSDPKNQTWTSTFISTTTQAEALSAGDINRDGKIDLLLGNIWLEKTSTGWTPHTLGSVPTGTEPDRNALADINNNGRLDAVVSLENGTEVYWFAAPSDPKTTWTRNLIGNVPGQGFSMDTADIDQDGDIDVVLGEHRGSSDNRVIIFENIDNGASWKQHVIDRGHTTEIDHHVGTQLVDLDNDGDFDLISLGWYNKKIWIYENTFNLSGIPTPTPPASVIDNSPWWDSRWPHRMKFTVNPNGTSRYHHIIDIPVSFSINDIDDTSMRLVEVGKTGEIVDISVPYQFNFDPGSYTSGRLVLTLTQTTSANQNRYYYLYAGTKNLALPSYSYSPKLTVSSITDQGFDSFEIKTKSGYTYVYHKTGGGFSKLLSPEGKDWISYKHISGSEASGWYRGIPNAGYPEDVLHPGRTGANTYLTHQGPLRVAIHSEVQGYHARWDIFNHRATMTMLSAPHSYWIQYEGTPGGKTEEGNTVLLSNGQQLDGTQTYAQDMPGEEWAIFGSAADSHRLFFAHHEEDNEPERFWYMKGPSNNPEGMFVFAFGRDGGVGTKLSGIHRVSLGFFNSTQITDGSGYVRSHYKAVAISQGSLQTFDKTIPLACIADVNQDKTVDFLDLSIVTSFFNSLIELFADLNNNGRIDIFDFNMIVSKFGSTCI
jgi:hypothetical protein